MSLDSSFVTFCARQAHDLDVVQALLVNVPHPIEKCEAKVLGPLGKYSTATSGSPARSMRLEGAVTGPCHRAIAGVLLERMIWRSEWNL